MSHITLKDLLDKEIRFLNRRIDRKILSGRPYYKDSLKHQVLIAQYRRIQSYKKRDISLGMFLTA